MNNTERLLPGFLVRESNFSSKQLKCKVTVFISLISHIQLSLLKVSLLLVICANDQAWPVFGKYHLCFSCVFALQVVFEIWHRPAQFLWTAKANLASLRPSDSDLRSVFYYPKHETSVEKQNVQSKEEYFSGLKNKNLVFIDKIYMPSPG